MSIVDLSARTVAAEATVGSELSDLIALADGNHFLASDQKRHELILLELKEGEPNVIRRERTVRYPARMVTSQDGRRVYVSGLWSHSLQAFELHNEAGSIVSASRIITLPFAPRELLHLAEQDKLIVTGAFGGEIAIVDAMDLKVERTHQTGLSNIRGLALSHDGRTVYLACQEISQQASTTRQDIDLGRLINNVVRVLDVDDLLGSKIDLADDGRTLPLGGAGHGAGDPSSLAVLDDHRLAVTLGGTNELAIVNVDNGQVQTSPVGRNPSAVIFPTRSLQTIVLNRLADSLSIAPVDSLTQSIEISLGPHPELSPSDQGELLFYNSRLSRDGWMSCHSCHTDGHSNGRLVDTFGDGDYGAPKRVLTLLGVGLTDTWAWNGQIKELHQQVDRSITSTMHGGQLSAERIGLLTAFLHGLSSPPPLQPADQQSSQLIERGRAVFDSRGCGNCHVPPLTYTKNGAVDAGISDEHGNDKFNPPSLRGVSQQSGYFHDKRAATLEEVFEIHGHQLDEDLSKDDLRALVRFLRSL